MTRKAVIPEPMKIAMIVLDANDASGMSHRDYDRLSPVLHPAIENLLAGLRGYENEVQIEVWYGTRSSSLQEFRRDGNIHYHPVFYRNLPIPGMGGGFAGRTLALLRAIRKSDAHLLHAQGTERECGLVAALSRKISLLTLHGNFREIVRSMQSKAFSNFWICAKLESFILPRVSAVHALSRHTQASVAGLAKGCSIIPNAVSDAFFEVVPEPTAHPNIHCVAGINEWKNPLALVHASDLLRNQHPNTEIHFHGFCNPLHPYGGLFLEEVAKRPWCKFHGVSTSSKIAHHFKHATCLALPSLQENFGLAAAEAMAAGVPVVASDAGGLKDVVQHEITGYSYPLDQTDGLLAGLLHIHQNAAYRAELAVNAREYAKRHFKKEVVAEAHLNLYQQLIDDDK